MDIAERAREDGYVHCDECGHMLEGHTGAGCGECLQSAEGPCPTRLTRTELRKIRAGYGLPQDLPRDFFRP